MQHLESLLPFSNRPKTTEKQMIKQKDKYYKYYYQTMPGGFPYSSVGKESACNAGDPGSIPGLGRSPGEGTGNPLQYSCLENTIDREAWWAMVYGIAKSQTRPSN